MAPMKVWLNKIWRENRSFFVFIVLMLVFRSAVADWSQVPTGSMKPTIVEGDRIVRFPVATGRTAAWRHRGV